MMIELTWMHVALLLVFLHFLADFPLQGEYIATNKDPASGNPNWIWIMSAHCTIHAGFVLLVTGSAVLFFLELFTHFAVEYSQMQEPYRIHHGSGTAFDLKIRMAYCTYTDRVECI